MLGTLVAARLGDAHPYAAVVGTAGSTLVAVVLLLVFPASPVPTLVVLTVLGLTGLSANPILSLLAIRGGGSAPTLASALVPAAFNAGTAVGTGITAVALRGPSGVLAPVQVGFAAAVLVLVASVAIAVTRPRSPAPSTAAPAP